MKAIKLNNVEYRHTVILKVICGISWWCSLFRSEDWLCVLYSIHPERCSSFNQNLSGEECDHLIITQPSTFWVLSWGCWPWVCRRSWPLSWRSVWLPFIRTESYCLSSSCSFMRLFILASCWLPLCLQMCPAISSPIPWNGWVSFITTPKFPEKTAHNPIKAQVSYLQETLKGNLIWCLQFTSKGTEAQNGLRCPPHRSWLGSKLWMSPLYVRMSFILRSHVLLWWYRPFLHEADFQFVSSLFILQLWRV